MANESYHNPYRVHRDDPNVLHQFTLDEKGRVRERTQTRLTSKHYSKTLFPSDKEPPKGESPRDRPGPRSRLSPGLKHWLDVRRPQEEVEIGLTLREDMRIPLLPLLGLREDREGETRRSAAIREIAASRKTSQSKHLEGLPFRPQEHFWIVNAVMGAARLGDVARILECSDVVYVQPRFGGVPPSPDPSSLNDPVVARRDLISDPYFDIPLNEPDWIGLLDSGVRRSHRLLMPPSRIAWWRDTVHGGLRGYDSSAPDFNPDDTINHGTSSAAILSGTASLGDAYRGLTPVQIDSWRVFENHGEGGQLDLRAVLRAIEAGLEGCEDYLVALVQLDEEEWGMLAQAFDNAFDAGVIVVAANGNSSAPGGSTVFSPAIAHKVLGVGAYDTISRVRSPAQARGPTHDGRIKPDIQGPTNTETASSTGDGDLRVYGNTSGATPYAAGVAVLAYRWLRHIGWHDKGLVYAYMILYGQRSYPFDNAVGAGPLRMLVNAVVNHGRFLIADGQNVEIPVDVGPNRHDFNAALWWPEHVDQDHSDIDLFLIGPDGTIRDSSTSVGSVFERARVSGPLEQGQWRIVLRGFDVPTGTQEVYLAAGIHFA